ncbi:heterodisulfide reductase, iron-sulfur binding subunit [Desulfocucumis palustris]|uniref:Heterodisulfide reductase, iron-sulfur binding subunit n=2 Tax=Desulfocucumis palustris TaxID=1898651 RepID=A0A2L2XLQ8_9FIRM|nr:heterodisulfide reductase, iron-sulfur binding subunit [Desulfocucumis palustris]
MTAMLIDNGNITKFLDSVARDRLLVAPVREEDNVVMFRHVTGGEPVCLDYLNASVSPREMFFPATEKMFAFSTADGGLQPAEPAKGKRVLFGARPCDVKAILSIDPVFSGDFPDPLYLDKREKTTIVALACTNPSHRCFCATFGVDPAGAEGADLLLTQLESCYLAEAITPKGNDLLEAYRQFFSTASGGHAAEKNRLAGAAAQKVNKLDTGGIKELLDENFELPYWEELALKCLNCGICTYICPTCHCFNIMDFTRGGTGGVRCRTWDSCMFMNFTRMAGGHNPRPTRKERLRNRFMHKLKYHLDRYNLPGCVGCGRCAGACPANIDIRQIIKELREVAQNGR